MNFRVELANELPFMVHLPDGAYEVSTFVDGTIIDVTLNLASDIYRLHYSPFPNKGLGIFFDGTGDELQKIVTNRKIPNYSFQKLKSYIKCTQEEHRLFTLDDLDALTRGDLEERLKTLIVAQQLVLGSSTLEQYAKDQYDRISSNSNELHELKMNFLIHKAITSLSMSALTSYYSALNSFIRQYAYIRNDIFVEPLTRHSLEGTYYRQYVDGQFYEQIKWAGKAPTLFPTERWMGELDGRELDLLKQRLKDGSVIPPTVSLILVAKGLLERGDYRSAVIETSAALEIAVEQKITQKMQAAGKSDVDISTYLDKTKNNFYQRCDYQLKACTGFSFVTDNATMWATIDGHRKGYRHKIAHSDANPDERKTEEIIKDFEAAIHYVESL